jgi:PAS domain S-box-containing protein
MSTLREYASFLLKNHLDAFVHTTINNLEKTHPESWQMFNLSKEQIFDFSKNISAGFLDALIEGRELERAERLAQLSKDQLPELQTAFLNLKNLSYAYSAQRYGLTNFLLKFSKEEGQIISILEEIDMYYTKAQAMAYQKVFDYMSADIQQKNMELEILNNSLEEKVKQRTSELEKANKLIHSVIDNIPGLVAMVGKNLKYQYVNKAYESWFGKKGSEILGRDISEVLGPVLFEATMPKIKAALKGQEQEFEVPITNNMDGSMTASVRIKPTFKSNEVDGFSVLVMDITEQNKAKEAIIESEKRLKTLAESVPMKVWSMTADGELEYVNQEWSKYSGLSFEQTRENPTFMIHPEDLHNIEEAREVKRAEKKPYEYEARIKDINGHYRWHLIKNAPLLDEAGNVVQWFGTSAEIHEQKLKEQRKDDFIGIAGHELKTPLTSLKAYAELLSLQPLDSLQSKYISNINIQVKRLEKLVSDLLDVTKINTGTLNLANEKINWKELVESAIETIQSAAPSHIFIKPEMPDVYINGDYGRLSQVITNLLSNAVKYSKDGSEVKINFDYDGKNLKTTVMDKGVGIKDTEVNNVFTKFYRAQNPMSNAQGLGIGLYIAKQITSLHQGDIQVKSEFGNGSAFTVILPANKE